MTPEVIYALLAVGLFLLNRLGILKVQLPGTPPPPTDPNVPILPGVPVLPQGQILQLLIPLLQRLLAKRAEAEAARVFSDLASDLAPTPDKKEKTSG